MASELVRLVWCTKCGRDKPATHVGEVFVIAGVRKQDDMCDNCWEALVLPLVEHLREHGMSPEQREPLPERAPSNPRHFCTTCGEGYVYESNLKKHKERRHGIVAVEVRNEDVPEPNENGEIFCSRCPEQGPWHSKNGFRTHQRSNIHKAHLGLTA